MVTDVLYNKRLYRTVKSADTTFFPAYLILSVCPKYSSLLYSAGLSFTISLTVTLCLQAI